jgi:hypothetical protein
MIILYMIYLMCCIALAIGFATNKSETNKTLQMISKTYLEMTPREKTAYMGRVVILSQSQEFFGEMIELIRLGEDTGLFDTQDAADASHPQIKDLDSPIENGIK